MVLSRTFQPAAAYSNFISSNQGILFIFIRSAAERGPIQNAAFEMMGKLGSIPGIFAFLRPFPVLEINTGATAQTQGMGFLNSSSTPSY